MARASARAAALQLVYEQMMGGQGGEETKFGLLSLAPDDEEMRYIDDVVSGVAAKQTSLDKKIEPLLVDWTMERLARVDLAILRLACYEMLHREDIPSSVSISEAVELAHTYSTPEASSFINGVLGSLARAEERL